MFSNFSFFRRKLKCEQIRCEHLNFHDNQEMSKLHLLVKMLNNWGWKALESSRIASKRNLVILNCGFQGQEWTLRLDVFLCFSFQTQVSHSIYKAISVFIVFVVSGCSTNYFPLLSFQYELFVHASKTELSNHSIIFEFHGYKLDIKKICNCTLSPWFSFYNDEIHINL